MIFSFWNNLLLIYNIFKIIKLRFCNMKNCWLMKLWKSLFWKWRKSHCDRVSNGFAKYYAKKFYEIPALCIIIKVAIELSMCNDFVIPQQNSACPQKEAHCSRAVCVELKTRVMNSVVSLAEYFYLFLQFP